MSLAFRTVPVLAVLALCLAGRGQAADFNMKVSVDGIRLGKHLMGAEVKPNDLRNRVVLLEFWGVNCPPCLASMPKLSAWNFEMQSLGLVVIGAHAQGGPAERIQATARSRGANYTIVENASVKDGQDFRGIPHCMLFDHTGKCLFRGSPDQLEPLLRRAVMEAPAVILEGKQLVKLTALNTSLKREQGFGAILKKVQADSTSKDPAVAEEAAFVAEKLTAYGRKLLDEAQNKKAKEPLATWQLTQRVATNFAGTKLGTEASGTLSDLKKDAAFQADLKAWQTLQQVRTLQATLQAPPGVENPTDPKFQALNARALRQMTTLIKQIQKSAPESKACEAAQQIAGQVGLKLD
jgi:thiol-disulfide isomerase/thioredoxin